MLFTSPSARINNVRELCLNDIVEDDIMKSDRFAPLTKPRSISRESDALPETLESKIAKLIDYDLDANLNGGDVFDITDLRPIETKKFCNLDAYPHAFEKDFDVLSWATAMLSESPLALAHLKAAQDAGWAICLNDLGTDGFHLDVQNKIIELDHYGLEAASLGRSAFFRNSIICVLAKAFRDIWHEEKWGSFEGNYKPEAVVMLERARAADADSVAIVIGWELRQAGYTDVWRHILGSEESDMAQVLTNILERYPTAIYSGIALAHVFRQWYVDVSRVDALDHSTLEHMDYTLRGNDMREEKFGNKNAESHDFEILSTLPDGTVYLKELGETVSRDPFFSGLNDAINQAHLFQIVYDSKVTYVSGIPFRDAALARKFLSAD